MAGFAADAEGAIRGQLSAGERLLWSGRPRQGLVFRASDFFMVPFSLMWGGFAFFWEYNVAFVEDAPLFMKLWGVPFVFMGIYMIAGRFQLDAMERSHMSYGLTDRRVIIVSGVFNRRIKSLNLRNLSDVSLDEKVDGGGTISFGASPFPNWWSNSRSLPGSPSPVPTFELVDNAKAVFEMIRAAQESIPKGA